MCLVKCKSVAWSCFMANVNSMSYDFLIAWYLISLTNLKPEGVSLHMVGFPNEFSGDCKFADCGYIVKICRMILFSVLDDASASLMQRHLISNGKYITKCSDLWLPSKQSNNTVIQIPPPLPPTPTPTQQPHPTTPTPATLI